MHATTKNAPIDEVRAKRIFELKADVEEIKNLDGKPENRLKVKSFAASLVGRLREVGHDSASDADLSLVGLNKRIINAWAQCEQVRHVLLVPRDWRHTRSNMNYR